MQLDQATKDSVFAAATDTTRTGISRPYWRTVSGERRCDVSVAGVDYVLIIPGTGRNLAYIGFASQWGNTEFIQHGIATQEQHYALVAASNAAAATAR